MAQLKGDIFVNGKLNKAEIVGQISLQNAVNQFMQMSVNNMTIDFNKNIAVINAPQVKIADSAFSINSTILTDISKELIVKNINVPYRQTKQLSELSAALIKSEEILKQPDSIETDGVNPVIGLKICTIEQKANWIYERILEIETHLKSIEQDVSFPSIAILANSKTDIEPLVSALNERLQNINIDVEACYENAKGTDNHVRVFCLDYIKGLEFEAAFFIDVDKIIERMPKLYDKFLYVGISRAATFLGITCGQEVFPKELNHIRKYFVENWKEAS